MQYSCALFAEGDDLASAQLHKLGLDLQEAASSTRPASVGHRLRPGGLARHPARHYELPRSWDNNFAGAIRSTPNVGVTGRTWKSSCVTTASSPERFDRVVSVGMVEHVGYKNYRAYMRAAARSLGEDGLFLA